jgi:hypothetical protein
MRGEQTVRHEPNWAVAEADIAREGYELLIATLREALKGVRQQRDEAMDAAIRLEEEVRALKARLAELGAADVEECSKDGNKV